MKQTILLLMLVLLGACHGEQDDLMTTATVWVSAGDDISISRIQATALFTNMNSRQVTSTTNFNGPAVQVLLLRGAYQVHIEGVVTYTDADGTKHVRQFRALSDYVALANSGHSEANISLLFLD